MTELERFINGELNEAEIENLREYYHERSASAWRRYLASIGKPNEEELRELRNKLDREDTEFLKLYVDYKILLAQDEEQKENTQEKA